MKRLYVFYDGECGLCGRFREWLQSQPAHLELMFCPFQSEEARRICPDLFNFQPDQQLIVLSDEGGIYAGEHAWLMCLYALREYRGWAKRLSNPALLPLVKRICLLVSHHRLTLSRALLQLPNQMMEDAVVSAGPL